MKPRPARIFFRAGLERVVDVVVVLVGLEFFSAGGDVENRLVARGGALLRQVAEVGAALPLDGAGVGLFLAEDEAEERRFAGSVGPDQAEAVGAGNEERHIREEFAGAIGLGNIGDGEHRNPTVNTREGRAVNGALARRLFHESERGGRGAARGARETRAR